MWEGLVCATHIEFQQNGVYNFAMQTRQTVTCLQHSREMHSILCGYLARIIVGARICCTPSYWCFLACFFVGAVFGCHISTTLFYGSSLSYAYFRSLLLFYMLTLHTVVQQSYNKRKQFGLHRMPRFVMRTSNGEDAVFVGYTYLTLISFCSKPRFRSLVSRQWMRFASRCRRS